MTATPRAQSQSSSPCKGEDRWGSAASRFSRTLGKTAAARRLRRDATKAERKLWYFLQRKQMAGQSFRRQRPFGKYFVDFYCVPLRLAVEVDGGQHDRDDVRTRDRERTNWLKAKGVTVLRFWNNDVLENIEGVCEEIARAIAALSERPAIPTLTLPLSGGGNDFGEVDR
jgi:very-short-patch-repair endonuclease